MKLMQLLLMQHLLMDEAGDGGGGGGGGGGGQGDPPAFQSLVPQGYADKGWMKGVDSMDRLFEKMDGAQNMLGQRNYIPADDANPDHVNEFYQKLRPESVESYVFGDVEMPEGMQRTPEAETAVKKIFHEAGLSKHQAKLVQVGYDKFLAEQIKTKSDGDSEKQNAEFDTLSNEIFGDRKETALANSKALLDKFAPEKMGDHIKGLDNKTLAVVASILDQVHQEYVAEDGGDGGAGGGGNDGMTDESVSNRISAIRTELDKYPSKAMHPQYKALSGEMQKLYKWKDEQTKKKA